MDVKPVYLPVDLINRWLEREYLTVEDEEETRAAVKRTRNHPSMRMEEAEQPVPPATKVELLERFGRFDAGSQFVVDSWKFDGATGACTYGLSAYGIAPMLTDDLSQPDWRLKRIEVVYPEHQLIYVDRGKFKVVK